MQADRAHIIKVFNTEFGYILGHDLEFKRQVTYDNPEWADKIFKCKKCHAKVVICKTRDEYGINSFLKDCEQIIMERILG